MTAITLGGHGPPLLSRQEETGGLMIEHRTNEWGRHGEQADRAAAERARLILDWYLDPTTGKPAARWVRAPVSANAGQEWPSAA